MGYARSCYLLGLSMTFCLNLPHHTMMCMGITIVHVASQLFIFSPKDISSKKVPSQVYIALYSDSFWTVHRAWNRRVTIKEFQAFFPHEFGYNLVWWQIPKQTIVEVFSNSDRNLSGNIIRLFSFISIHVKTKLRGIYQLVFTK